MLFINRKFSIFALIKPGFYSTHASNKLKEHVQEKVVKVAVIGLPNSGKSTLINAIMEKRVNFSFEKFSLIFIN